MLFSLWIACITATVLMLCPSEWSNGGLRHPRAAGALALASGALSLALLDGAGKGDPMGQLVSRIGEMIFFQNAPLWAISGLALAFYLITGGVSDTDNPFFTGTMCLIALAIVAALGRGAMCPRGPGLNGLERDVMFIVAGMLGAAATLLYAARAAWRAYAS